VSSFQGFTTLLSGSRGQKWIQDLPKPYKYSIKIIKKKREAEKRGKKKKKIR
jgi:hypothetical protein